jgi:transposase-like protein
MNPHRDAEVHLFRFSWKWRRRSPSKVKERAHEEARKHYTPEEKVAILRRHLLEQVPISELCDKHGLQPTVFYRWQKEFFENRTAAFEPNARPKVGGGAEATADSPPESRLTFSSCPLGGFLDRFIRMSRRWCGALTSGLPTIRTEALIPASFCSPYARFCGDLRVVAGPSCSVIPASRPSSAVP